MVYKHKDELENIGGVLAISMSKLGSCDLPEGE
jgi:hypothetical protein